MDNYLGKKIKFKIVPKIKCILSDPGSGGLYGMRLVIQITKVYWFLLKPSPHQDLRKVKVKFAQSCPILCDPMNVQSMKFSRPEYWSG